MTKHIVGSYLSEEEAIRAVKNLEVQGYKAEYISVITNKNKPNQIKEETDVDLKSGKPDPYGQLIELGVAKEDAEINQGELKSENFLVAVRQIK